MRQLLLVCVGSAVGGGARYLLSSWLVRCLGPAFPFGTLAVNVIGSFLIGCVMVAGGEAGVISPTVRITLAVGLLGGFTTYSAFAFETLERLQSGALALASLNVLVTVIACLLACYAGGLACRWLFGG